MGLLAEIQPADAEHVLKHSPKTDYFNACMRIPVKLGYGSDVPTGTVTVWYFKYCLFLGHWITCTCVELVHYIRTISKGKLGYGVEWASRGFEQFHRIGMFDEIELPLMDGPEPHQLLLLPGYRFTDLSLQLLLADADA